MEYYPAEFEWIRLIELIRPKGLCGVHPCGWSQAVTHDTVVSLIKSRKRNVELRLDEIVVCFLAGDG